MEEDIFQEFEGEDEIDDTEIMDNNELSLDGWIFDFFNL